MKSRFYFVASATVAGMLLFGCEKESSTTPTISPILTNPPTELRYVVDGVENRAMYDTEYGADSLLTELFALVREGRALTLKAQIDLNDNVTENNEPIVFITSSEREAIAWTEQMSAQGYDVDVSYNPRTRLYTCIAVIPSPESNSAEEQIR